MQEKLRQGCKALLEEGKVDYIIGFEPGTLKFTTTPLVTKSKEDADRLVVNPFITSNLAKFLIKQKGKVGIVAKGCDSRSIVSLIQDNKVSRQNLVIVGVPCHGIIDLKKVEKLVGRERADIDDIVLDGEKVKITVEKETKEFPLTYVLYDHCLACECPTPQEYDILLDEPVAARADRTAGDTGIKELEGKTPSERWQYWKEQFQRCMRCNACRQVCPICFCERCFADETEPQWISNLPNWQENLIFQVVRNIHDAGRCTDCGACERACPVGIPLRKMTKKMCDTVGELFDYKAGTNKDAPPLMASYESEEAEELFR